MPGVQGWLTMVSLLASVSSFGQYLQVTHAGSDDVSTFAIDDSGMLQPVGAPFPVGLAPSAALIGPGQTLLFVANQGANNVSMLSIDPQSGALTELPGSPYDTGGQPVALAIEWSVPALYVANGDSGTIVAFTITEQRGLVRVGDPLPAAAWPTAMATNPRDHFLYVADAVFQGIVAFGIDPSTGDLAPIQRAPLNLGAPPRAMALHPSFNALYVALDSNVVLQFQVLPGGQLGFQQAAPTGAQPAAMVVDRAGRFLYLAHAGSTDVWTYDLSEGLLIPIFTGFGLAAVPTAMALSPSEDTLYIASASGNTVSVEHRDTSSGDLTPVADVYTGDGPIACGGGEVSCDNCESIKITGSGKVANARAATVDMGCMAPTAACNPTLFKVTTQYCRAKDGNNSKCLNGTCCGSGLRFCQAAQTDRDKGVNLGACALVASPNCKAGRQMCQCTLNIPANDEVECGCECP